MPVGVPRLLGGRRDMNRPDPSHLEHPRPAQGPEFLSQSDERMRHKGSLASHEHPHGEDNQTAGGDGEKAAEYEGGIMAQGGSTFRPKVVRSSQAQPAPHDQQQRVKDYPKRKGAHAIYDVNPFPTRLNRQRHVQPPERLVAQPEARLRHPHRTSKPIILRLHARRKLRRQRNQRQPDSEQRQHHRDQRFDLRVGIGKLLPHQ